MLSGHWVQYLEGLVWVFPFACKYPISLQPSASWDCTLLISYAFFRQIIIIIVPFNVTNNNNIITVIDHNVNNSCSYNNNNNHFVMVSGFIW